MTPLDSLLSRSSTSQLVDPAPEGETLNQILQAGLRAPDHGRLRPWRFVLIRGSARDLLADITTAAIKRRDPEAAITYIERQRSRILTTPLIIAAGARVKPGHKIPELEQLFSTAAATMNVLNGLQATGFGGIWLTGPNCYDPVIGQALGFEHPDRLVAFLYVGTPAEPARAPKTPDLLDHVLDWTGPVPAGVTQHLPTQE
jgi:nitroreductase